MRKYIMWGSISGGVIIAVLVIAGVFLFDNPVEKARKLLAANMIPQAAELLTNEIQESPMNPEAHLELGNIYLQAGFKCGRGTI